MSKGISTRNRIVETALRSASIDGIEGITLGKVAADVGMSKSGLFAHFESKEALQVDVIAAAAEKFTAVVVRPAFEAARGEPRVRALFEHWLQWERNESLPGVCVFTHAAAELDDRPGPALDALVDWQQQWLDALAKAARIAVNEGHFHTGVDAELFAFQQYGLVMAYYHARRLFQNPRADDHVRRAFDALVLAARA